MSGNAPFQGRFGSSAGASQPSNGVSGMTQNRPPANFNPIVPKVAPGVPKMAQSPRPPMANHPMMMWMQMMKNNPKFDPEWVEYCMPRMMSTMTQIVEEFKVNKRVRNIFFNLIFSNKKLRFTYFICFKNN